MLAVILVITESSAKVNMFPSRPLDMLPFAANRFLSPFYLSLETRRPLAGSLCGQTTIYCGDSNRFWLQNQVFRTVETAD
jgi:hypothetical protein